MYLEPILYIPNSISNIMSVSHMILEVIEEDMPPPSDHLTVPSISRSVTVAHPADYLSHDEFMEICIEDKSW